MRKEVPQKTGSAARSSAGWFFHGHISNELQPDGKQQIYGIEKYQLTEQHCGYLTL